MSASNRGSLIVIESNDRAGKTTICEHLISVLPNAVYMKFPNRNGKHGKIIDDYLLNKINLPKDEIYKLFVENRQHEKENIASLLNQGRHVICDRYCYSGIVYTTYDNLSKSADTNFGTLNNCASSFSTNFGRLNNTIISMNNLLKNESGLPKPDILFLIKGNYRDGSNERYDNCDGIYELFESWFTNGTNSWTEINNIWLCNTIKLVENIYHKDSKEYKIMIEKMSDLIKKIELSELEYINLYHI